MTDFEKTDRPTPDWDATQVETDRGETREERDRAAQEHAAEAERTHWDKDQMAEDTGTGRGGERIVEEPTKEGESALSGQGRNPGGGQRWAERERSEKDVPRPDDEA
jgi:hypothetical protein